MSKRLQLKYCIEQCCHPCLSIWSVHGSVYISVYPDTVPPIHIVSYHVATDKSPLKVATSSGLFLVTVYNQLLLAERKHVARYWSINTAVTAVPLSTHPSPIEVAAATTAKPM